jgi:putative peptidoglycan lipid II flippase
MRKTVIILMILTIISKILGFARDITFSYFYGASIISDAYLISMTIPTVIFAMIGQGISTGFIPMYTRIESKNGIEQANHYTNNVVNVVMLLCTIIVVIGLLFTESIVNLFASGFEGKTLELAITFTRISLIGVFFTGLIYVFSGYLQIKEVFLIPVLMGLPSNFIFIGTFFISSHTNIYLLSVGSVIAIASQFFLLIIYGYKRNYRYKLRIDFKDKHIRKMIILALPAIFGSSIAQINILIDRTLASQISVGGISALNYAHTINLIIQGIVVSSITTVLYPKISKLAVGNNIKEMKKYISSAISAVNVMVLPATVGYMIFAEPIVKLLYGRGEFDSQDITLTSHALFFFSIGMVSISLREILSKVFYSLQDTKTPMINASIALLVNIVLNLVLSRYLGIGGLALATSISLIFCSFLLFINLRKKIGNFGIKTIAISFTKIFLASLAMGGISKFTYDLLINSLGLTFSLLASAFFGIIIYFIIIYYMKIEEVNMFVLRMKRKSKNIPKENEAS